jgi:hypothetical protein
VHPFRKVFFTERWEKEGRTTFWLGKNTQTLIPLAPRKIVVVAPHEKVGEIKFRDLGRREK